MFVLYCITLKNKNHINLFEIDVEKETGFNDFIYWGQNTEYNS